ncbi:transketolase C-terminal domain-containing protein [Streptomyces sp. NPDC050433]|uniref:transketolase C-terminal domain-containing protein n=1 Tax=Streptomyces sp. NPDC050433 TaxID=3365615 RepID=UPI0037BCE71D
MTLPETVRAGGVGSAIAQALRDAGVHTPLREFGIPRRFLSHGSGAEVPAACGLTAQNITRVVVELLTGLDAAPASAGIDDPGTWSVHGNGT